MIIFNNQHVKCVSDVWNGLTKIIIEYFFYSWDHFSWSWVYLGRLMSCSCKLTHFSNVCHGHFSDIWFGLILSGMLCAYCTNMHHFKLLAWKVTELWPFSWYIRESFFHKSDSGAKKQQTDIQTGSLAPRGKHAGRPLDSIFLSLLFLVLYYFALSFC